MTLNEKFKEFTRQESWQTENYMANECEHIADKFAIDFTHWCTRHYIRLGNTVIWEDSYDENKYTTHQLLKIYKKTL
jgi:hypothetical protein